MSVRDLVKNGGPQNVWLDILSTSGTRRTDLTYNSSITIEYITDNQSSSTTLTLVEGTIGTVLVNSFVHYSNGIYQLTLPNIDTGNKVLLRWYGTDIATGEKNFSFSGLGSYGAGSYQSSIAILKLRYLINDLNSSDYEYSDEMLGQLLLVSSCYVKCDISADYEIDFSTGETDPVLTDAQTCLVTLKAACLLTQSEMKSNVNCGVKIVDGPTTIDTSGMPKNLVTIAQTYCEDYELAKVQYLLKNSEGCSSTTPYGGLAVC